MIDTDLRAQPWSLTAVIEFLDTGVKEVGTWAEESRRAARKGAEVWSGEAGGAFTQVLTDGAVAAEDLVEDFSSASAKVFALLTPLQECIDAMTQARDVARAAGLAVDGFTVYPPGRTSWSVQSDPNATQREVQYAVQQAQAWSTATDLHYRATRTWHNAVASFAKEISTDNIRLLGAGSGVTVGGALDVVKARTHFYTESLDFLNDQSISLGRSLDGLVVDGKLVGSRQFFNQLVDESSALVRRTADASDALEASKRLGSHLSKASVALGVIGFGYGAYNDVQDGESVTQALVSNGVDWGVAAGFTAGGAAIGSFIVPPVGTVVGGAISAGWNEVKDIGGAIGDAASGV